MDYNWSTNAICELVAPTGCNARFDCSQRNETVPVWQAVIRLLAHITLSTTTLPDFQRSVALPNVSKLSAALQSLTEKQPGDEVVLLSLETLAQLVKAFPTSHRSMTDSLSKFCLRILDGSSRSTPPSIALAASSLYASLHVTGGKVGGSALWRKGVDETIIFVKKALDGLRTSYAIEGEPKIAVCRSKLSIFRRHADLRQGSAAVCFVGT